MNLLPQCIHARFLTNNLRELTWYTGCASKRKWELGTLEITQKALVYSMMSHVKVKSYSRNPATPGVELRQAEEGDQRNKERLAV